VLALVGGTATAVTFTEIRIGDLDGFGLGNGAGLSKASGGPVNVGPGGILTNGDFLPDWSGNGSTATGSGDDFDYRSAAEIGGASLNGQGFADVASDGSQFTDISLSTSYGSSASGGQVHIPGGTGSGGPFPKPPAATRPNQPGFVFDFTVAKADLAAGTPMFFNLVYADYDVTPARVDITTVGGQVIQRNINVQPPTQDGLIQAAFLNLAFNDVFVDQGATWGGQLSVDFVAPNEPYTAFDYVELSTRPVSTVIPEPLTALAVFGGLSALGGYVRRRRGA
jgi:hypothetical protein